MRPFKNPVVVTGKLENDCLFADMSAIAQGANVTVELEKEEINGLCP